jgi:hypothetical protein
LRLGLLHLLQLEQRLRLLLYQRLLLLPQLPLLHLPLP